ncbi:hypothetical protein CACET_c23240 [Clostridium aceticum]|uniref:Uncharacterized protein n=1 Tax=Clostridium aceticum TaxID=84022 RepID=A0A0G3WD22_9CLOT|nr:hypothetical protein CACET_c23240 [Clostridium aceticum]
MLTVKQIIYIIKLNILSSTIKKGQGIYRDENIIHFNYLCKMMIVIKP